MGTSCSGRSGFFCDKHIETKEEKEKRLRKKYGNIPLQEVIIYKTMPTLGLAFEGGATSRQMLPRVVSIQSNGSTFHSHTALQVGSILLEVNNSSLVGIQHSEVAASIANAFLDETSDYMKFLITEPGWEVKIGTKWPFSRVEASQLKTEKMVWKLKIDASAAEFFLYIILYFLLVGGWCFLKNNLRLSLHLTKRRQVGCIRSPIFADLFFFLWYWHLLLLSDLTKLYFPTFIWKIRKGQQWSFYQSKIHCSFWR